LDVQLRIDAAVERGGSTSFELVAELVESFPPV
jgi:hypothetical protein